MCACVCYLLFVRYTHRYLQPSALSTTFYSILRSRLSFENGPYDVSGSAQGEALRVREREREMERERAATVKQVAAMNLTQQAPAAVQSKARAQSVGDQMHVH